MSRWQEQGPVDKPGPSCLLLTAYCSLLTAHCLLLTAYCSLPTADCSLHSHPHHSRPTAAAELFIEDSQRDDFSRAGSSKHFIQLADGLDRDIIHVGDDIGSLGRTLGHQL